MRAAIGNLLEVEPMKFTKLIWLAILTALLLNACSMGATPAPTQDVGAIQTQAMGLVVTQVAMQQTQTALAIPPTEMPTLTPLPTATLGNIPTYSPILPGTGTPFAFNTPAIGFTPLASVAPTQAVDACNNSAYVSETIPDGTVFKPGIKFEKSWTIQNIGTCTWDEGYVFRYQGGTLGGYSIPLVKSSDFVHPGKMQTFKVNLIASLAEREYTECWKMQDDKGYYFGTYLCVKIVVKKK
jgi:hypothetical protein